MLENRWQIIFSWRYLKTSSFKKYLWKRQLSERMAKFFHKCEDTELASSVLASAFSLLAPGKCLVCSSHGFLIREIRTTCNVLFFFFFFFTIAVLLVRRFLKSYKWLSDGRLCFLGGVTLLVLTQPPVCWDLMGLSKCKLPTKIGL